MQKLIAIRHEIGNLLLDLVTFDRYNERIGNRKLQKVGTGMSKREVYQVWKSLSPNQVKIGDEVMDHYNPHFPGKVIEIGIHEKNPEIKGDRRYSWARVQYGSRISFWSCGKCLVVRTVKI